MWLLIVSIVSILFISGLYGAACRRANNYQRYGIAQQSTIELLRKTSKSERQTAAARLMAANDAYKLAEERRLGAGRALLKTINEKVATERQLSDAHGLIVGLRSERDELFDGQTEARSLLIKVHALLADSVKIFNPAEKQAPIVRATKLIEAERKDW